MFMFRNVRISLAFTSTVMEASPVYADKSSRLLFARLVVHMLTYCLAMLNVHDIHHHRSCVDNDEIRICSCVLKSSETFYSSATTC